jgi:hypothetical protein
MSFSLHIAALVTRIEWLHKQAPHTVNLPAGPVQLCREVNGLQRHIARLRQQVRNAPQFNGRLR